MSARYSRLRNPAVEHGVSEMEAAFDESDDEDNVHPPGNHDEQRRPLVSRHSSQPSQPTSPVPYDFERIDYDYPPPGSPPRPSSLALPANAAYGNTNGLVPDAPMRPPNLPSSRYRSWFSTLTPWLTRSVVSSRLGRIGGGTDNDGVFANLMSKPTRPRRYEDEEGVHIVPEDTQAEAPPSYASAQADAVPSYWETTIHAPAGGDVPGELIVDSLPTGSLFSFLWSMLVSVAFSFLGFVLTYLLHTTHAAKFGSRAGLGITLIQYGWALRTRSDDLDVAGLLADDNDMLSPQRPPSMSSGDDAEWQHRTSNTSIPYSSGEPNNLNYGGSYVLGENAAAWLSFFLMTVGWSLFLSSLLGFWRVKRWERGILRATPSAEPSVHPEAEEHEAPISFTFPGVFFREGLGFPSARRNDEEEGHGERFVVQEIDRARQMAETRLNDARLQRNLRTAGLI